jgi:hypothetical protein
MDLLPLRCYGLILATGRTFPLACRRALVSHQAIQIPSTDPGGLEIMGRGRLRKLTILTGFRLGHSPS